MTLTLEDGEDRKRRRFIGSTESAGIMTRTVGDPPHQIVESLSPWDTPMDVYLRKVHGTTRSNSFPLQRILLTIGSPSIRIDKIYNSFGVFLRAEVLADH